MNINFEYAQEIITLSDEHAASSYGQPVLIVGGRSYGPGDEIEPAADDELAWLPRESGLQVACSIQSNLRQAGKEVPALLKRFIAAGFAFNSSL